MKKALLSFLTILNITVFGQWYALPAPQTQGKPLEFIKPIGTGIILYTYSMPAGSHWYSYINQKSFDDLYSAQPFPFPGKIWYCADLNADTLAISGSTQTVGSFNSPTYLTWYTTSNFNTYTDLNLSMGLPYWANDLCLTRKYLYYINGTYNCCGDFTVTRKEVQTQAVYSYTSPVYDISFTLEGKMQLLNDSVGYLLCQAQSNTNKRFLLKTNDYANSWNQVLTDSLSNIISFHFPSDSLGYVACANGNILKTTNAGSTWSLIPNATFSYTFNCVRFVNDTVGYLGGKGGAVFKTINGAFSWSADFPPTSDDIKEFYSFDTVVYLKTSTSALFKNCALLTSASINERSFENSKLNVFPNPAGSQVTLKFAGNYTGSIRVYSSIGDVVEVYKVDAVKEFQIDTRDYKKGVYLVQPDGYFPAKFLKD